MIEIRCRSDNLKSRSPFVRGAHFDPSLSSALLAHVRAITTAAILPLARTLTHVRINALSSLNGPF